MYEVATSRFAYKKLKGEHPETVDQKTLSYALSRRDFLRTSGLGALAVAIPNRTLSYVSGAEHAGRTSDVSGKLTSGVK